MPKLRTRGTPPSRRPITDRPAVAAAVGIAAVVALWWIASAALGATLIPAPPVVFRTFWELILAGDILRHAGASLLRLIAGIATATVVAVPLGIAAGISSAADRLISPVVYVLYPIPKIAFLPVFMVLFGLGDVSKIVLLFAVVVFQLLIAARDGVRRIPRELRFAATSLRLSRWDRARRLYLPSALPQVFSALRVTVGIGIAVLFLAENYATRYGLGYFVMNNWVMINYPRMFAGILGLALLAAATLSALDRIERLSCPWLRVGTD